MNIDIASIDMVSEVNMVSSYQSSSPFLLTHDLCMCCLKFLLKVYIAGDAPSILFTLGIRVVMVMKRK